ncbi:MAG: threonine synthase [Clostridia bacterium]
MLYKSTRNNNSQNKTSAQAIIQGIASDGGLFVPEKFPIFSADKIASFVNMSYQTRAQVIMEKFLPDFSHTALQNCILQAYSATTFDNPAIAPLHRINEKVSILELWHGPTCAFKDIALQILPHLLIESVHMEKSLFTTAILVATSGDTGKAAMAGFKDIPLTKILVFYPHGGVSEVQKLQMVTQSGNNVSVVAIDGNFDDTQNGVKEIFANIKLKEVLAENNICLSSANSINWGRLVPQIVYYFSAYADAVKNDSIKQGDAINFVVPTGNFGNILAGYYAKKMGLPIAKLICAANENNVLTDFIHSGVYNRNRPFHKTISPSMDILISSNLERLLFDLNGENSDQIRAWMSELNDTGKYKINNNLVSSIQDLFWSASSDDLATIKRIEQVYLVDNYLIDTHTAVAWNVYDLYVSETNDNTYTIIVSTASPFKFNESVAKAVLPAEELNVDSLTLLNTLSNSTGEKIPAGLNNLGDKPILHHKIACKEKMLAEVENFLLH